MSIGSLSVVKSLLGITDTSKDVLLTAIISATDEWVELTCNRNFLQANYVLQEVGTNDKRILLPNKPINGICWSAYGAIGVIDVNYSGSAPGQLSVQDKTLVVSTSLARTEIDLTATSIVTIGDVATALNALTNWTATASTIYTSYPALSLLDRVYDFRLSTSGQFSIVAAVNPMDLKRVRDGEYRAFTSVSDATDMLIIYNGGYSTYPDGLIYAVSKIAADTYSALLRDSAMEEEDLGDYGYKLRSDYQNQAIQANWGLLLPYMNISL